jgi:hypothetical protein
MISRSSSSYIHAYAYMTDHMRQSKSVLKLVQVGTSLHMYNTVPKYLMYMNMYIR